MEMFKTQLTLSDDFFYRKFLMKFQTISLLTHQHFALFRFISLNCRMDISNNQSFSYQNVENSTVRCTTRYARSISKKKSENLSHVGIFRSYVCHLVILTFQMSSVT